MDSVYYTYYPSPIGKLAIARSRNGLTNILFEDQGVPETWILDEDDRLLKITSRELTEYFDGERQAFSLPLDLFGTVFQNKVWVKSLEIGYGETQTYGKLAENIGNKGSARAVGTALGSNKIPIIIPCHRIVPAKGGVGNYLGGSDVKAFLIELEQDNKHKTDTAK